MAYLWSERHAPCSEAALVIAKKKVGDVRDFLCAGASSGRRLLIIKGPAGCGKASVLRALCMDLGLELVEWSPASRGSRSNQAKPAEAPVVESAESLADSFLRFVAQADRYRGLDSLDSAGNTLSRPPSRPRVALVRDFPFTLLESSGGNSSRNAAVFVERFTAMVNGGALQRAAFCFNDSRDVHRMVTKLLARVDYRAVVNVVFDSVPRTFAQKALDAAAQAEGLPRGSVDTLALSAECGGDLRHALNALQLAAGGIPRVVANGCEAKPRGGRGRGKARAADVPVESKALLDGALRQQTLGLFHALGRLLWCKRVPPVSLDELETLATNGAVGAPANKRRRKPSKSNLEAGPEPQQLRHEQLVPKATRPPLYFIPEDVMAASNTEPHMMMDWIFTNSVRFYGDIEDLSNFAASLAHADAWAGGGSSGSSRHFNNHEVEGGALLELATSVQVRSLLDANLHPVPPSFSDPFAPHSQSDSPGGLAFNMVRPLTWDVARHRNRRLEELAGHLSMLGPQALGSLSISSTLISRTLPFVHRLLGASCGNHPTLRHLPYPLMQLNMDLNAGIDGSALRAGVADSQSSQVGSGTTGQAATDGTPSAAWSSALPDDPIEDS